MLKLTESITLVCIVLASCRATSQEPSSTATGTVRGDVRYVADPNHPWRLGRYYIRSAKTGELAEAVVALQRRGLKGAEAGREPKTVTVDQKNFQFVPETTAIRTGDKVRFLNSDEHPHNVRASHANHSFNVTMPVEVEHIEGFPVATGTRDPYQVDCIFHSAMKAWIFVFDHPWFQVTGKDGQYEFTDVPPGDYQIEVVHPAGGLREARSITVKAGETIEIPLRLQAVRSPSGP